MSVDATNAEGLNLAAPLSEPLVGNQQKRSSFIKNAIAYSGTNLVSQFAQLVSRFIVRAMLAPSAMGIWELALAIQSFVNSFDPGINTAASIELPKLQGAN